MQRRVRQVFTHRLIFIKVGSENMIFPDDITALLERVRQALPDDVRLYLVGGPVRDLLLGRRIHDLDFVLAGDALKVGRLTANALQGAYYPLDAERETARVILIHPDGHRDVLDFAAMRGDDIEADLRARDFTINAMALPLNEPRKLIDPLGGAADLHKGILRACSSQSLQDDPVRILRGVRLASSFGFKITPETRSQMRTALPELQRVSVERLRDELFRILGSKQAALSIRVLSVLGALQYVLPELEALKGVTQPPPHQADVWDHTLLVLQRLEAVFAVLAREFNEKSAESMALAQTTYRLGRYREQISAYLDSWFSPDRTRRELLLLAALYHDAGKPQTRTIEPDGRIRFFEHDQVGAELVAQRARELRLSNAEVDHLELIVRHHMRPLLLSTHEKIPSARAVYRFFRDTGPAGVDICLLSLADVMGTYGAALPHDTWGKHVDVVRALLEAWWEHAEQQVNPPPLVNGNDLMKALDLEPGPHIGELIEAVREAQVSGLVENSEQALEYARQVASRLSNV